MCYLGYFLQVRNMCEQDDKRCLQVTMPVEIFIINKEILKKTKAQSLPNLILSDEGKKLLEKQLLVLRNSIVEKISSSFVGSDI